MNAAGMRLVKSCVFVLTIAAVTTLVPFVGRAQAPGMPEGMTSTPVLNNERVVVAKLTFAPGARERVHAHALDIVVLQLTPGQVELSVMDDKKTSRQEAGAATFIPRGVLHSAANVGTEPFELLVVALR